MQASSLLRRSLETVVFALVFPLIHLLLLIALIASPVEEATTGMLVSGGSWFVAILLTIIILHSMHRRLPSFYLLLPLMLVGCASIQAPPASEPAPIPSSSLSSEARSVSSPQSAFPYVPQGEEMKNPDELPFTYNTGSLDLKLYRFTETASDEFQYLLKNSADTSCAPKRPAGYFDALAKTFAGATKTTYAFQAQTGRYRGSVFQLVLIPNLQKYHDVQKVKDDFYACDVGTTIGFKVSSEWLLFEFSCGGVDEGCGVIGDQLKPTINLRSGIRRHAGSDALGIRLSYPVTWGISQLSDDRRLLFETGACTECIESIEVESVNGRKVADIVKALDPSTVESVRDAVVAGQPAVEVQTTEFALKKIFFIHGTRLYTLTTDGLMEREGVLRSLEFLD